MAPSCVVVGQLASSRGWGGLCVYGVLWLVFPLSVPLLASVLAISFPIMPECARTLWIRIMCGVQYIYFTIYVISSLSWW